MSLRSTTRWTKPLLLAHPLNRYKKVKESCTKSRRTAYTVRVPRSEALVQEPTTTHQKNPPTTIPTRAVLSPLTQHEGFELLARDPCSTRGFEPLQVWTGKRFVHKRHSDLHQRSVTRILSSGLRLLFLRSRAGRSLSALILAVSLSAASPIAKASSRIFHRSEPGSIDSMIIAVG